MCAVPHIVFTPQLRRFTSIPEVDSHATTLRAALDDAFAQNPRLRGYVLDDQQHLRANVVIFIDGRRSTDRITPVSYTHLDVYKRQSSNAGTKASCRAT